LLKTTLIDLFFPKFCLNCGRPGVYLCRNCQGKLKTVEKDSCFYCHGLSYGGFTHPGCLRKNGLDGVISLFYYSQVLKKIIKQIKYRLAYDIWKEMELMIDPQVLKKLSLFKKLDGDFSLVPIPLHPTRLRERGFNQSELIAQYFHKVLGFPVSNVLSRKKMTVPQANLSGRLYRYRNMKGAFQTVIKNITGGCFVLVDDVTTSGITLKEGSRILKMSGARKVYGLTLAKG